jgi:hypothetical protein
MFLFPLSQASLLMQVTAPNKQIIKHVVSPRAPAHHTHHGLISSSKVEDEERDNGEQNSIAEMNLATRAKPQRLA